MAVKRWFLGLSVLLGVIVALHADVPPQQRYILTPYDFNNGAPVGPGNTQNCTVVATANNPVVTITGTNCIGFTAGQYIDLWNLGTTLSTAPIAAAPTLTSAGSGYTTIPSVVVTDSTGDSSFFGVPEALATASVSQVGSGCVNQAQTWNVYAAGYTTAGTVTATPSGGALTLNATLPITAAGAYQSYSSASSMQLVPTGSGGITASISGTTMTVTVASGSITLAVNQAITDTAGNVAPNTIITALGTGTGGTGTYTVSPSQTVSSEAMTALQNCLYNPAASVTFSLLQPVMVSPGSNYTAPTAAFSTGNATLGSLSLATPGTNVLTTQIVSVSGNAVTLRTAPSQTINSIIPVRWGWDNGAALNALIVATSYAGAPSLNVATPAPNTPCAYLPSGQWGTAETIVWNPNAMSSCLMGAGPESSKVVALAALTNVVHQGDSQGLGSVMMNVGWDGSKLTPQVGYFGCPAYAQFNNVLFNNAAPRNGGSASATPNTNLLWGDFAACGGGDIDKLTVRNETALYQGYQDQPSYLVLIGTNDVRGEDWTGYGSSNSGVYQASGTEAWPVAPGSNFDTSMMHLYGLNGTGAPPYYGYNLNNTGRHLNSQFDNFAAVGVALNSNGLSLIGGALLSAVSPYYTQGVTFGNNLYVSVNSGYNFCNIGINSSLNHLVPLGAISGVATFTGNWCQPALPKTLHPVETLQACNSGTTGTLSVINDDANPTAVAQQVQPGGTGPTAVRQVICNGVYWSN